MIRVYQYRANLTLLSFPASTSSPQFSLQVLAYQPRAFGPMRYPSLGYFLANALAQAPPATSAGANVNYPNLRVPNTQIQAALIPKPKRKNAAIKCVCVCV